jgi:hypothetical protein
MMMMLDHMRHRRQDNHATNHVRCTKTQGRAKQKAYRGQTKKNHILLKRVDYNAYPAKQWKSIMSILMGETQLLCTGAREPGCEQTRKDDEGQLHPSPLLGLADSGLIMLHCSRLSHYDSCLPFPRIHAQSLLHCQHPHTASISQT